MKLSQVMIVLALLAAAQSGEAALRRSSHALRVAAAPAASAAGAPSSGGGLPAVEVSFEIDNFNYVDMSQKVEVEDEVEANATVSTLNYTIPKIPSLNYTIPGYGEVKTLTYEVPPNATAETVNALVGTPPGGWPKAMISKKATRVPQVRLNKEVEDEVHGEKASDSIIMKPKSLLELHEQKLKLVRTIVEDSVEEAVRTVIKGEGGNTTNGTANATAEEPKKGRIFVSLSPGRTGTLSAMIQIKGQGRDPEEEDETDETVAVAPAPAAPRLVLPGKTTKVTVYIVDEPDNGADEVPEVAKTLAEDLENGILQASLEHMIYEHTGIEPRIDGLSVSATSIENWDVESCETHMKTIVDRFTVAYTRRMVPTAVFNECTNYIPSESFSHDKHITKGDVYKCRVATAKFSQAWNFGNGQLVPLPQAPAAGDAASPAGAALVQAPAPAGAPTHATQLIDFKDFCFDVCTIKFGEEAPQCHVTSGDKLMDAAK